MPLSESMSFSDVCAAVQARCELSETGCWLWTGSTTWGYADAGIGGKTQRLHRFVLSKKEGRPLQRHEQTLHSCDVRRCVNPDHLSVGSHKKNMAEMAERRRAARGTHNSQAKLDEERVEQILDDIARGRPLAHIAADNGVSHKLISDIGRGKWWRHVRPERFDGRASRGAPL